MSAEIQNLVAIQTDLCLSGGAEGADVQWGMNAGRLGHTVIHWSFHGHKSFAPEQETVRLDTDQLAVADPFLERANRTLKRVWPARSDYVCNLLRRNHYQVAWAESLYAVGVFKNGMVQGGTSWATQMYMDRVTNNELPVESCKLFFYDQALGCWMQWQGSWLTLEDAPPVPSGIWAGVGSRELLDNGKWAIRELMGWKRPEPTL